MTHVEKVRAQQLETAKGYDWIIWRVEWALANRKARYNSALVTDLRELTKLHMVITELEAAIPKLKRKQAQAYISAGVKPEKE
jgi:hypothetical protein